VVVRGRATDFYLLCQNIERRETSCFFPTGYPVFFLVVVVFSELLLETIVMAAFFVVVVFCVCVCHAGG
jgi:hypothetical protein